MNNEPSVMDQLCTEEKMFSARTRLKNKIKKVLTASGHELIDIAKKSVLDNQSLTRTERIFHESAMHYDPKRDTPSVDILSFDDWRKGEAQ